MYICMFDNNFYIFMDNLFFIGMPLKTQLGNQTTREIINISFFF